MVSKVSCEDDYFTNLPNLLDRIYRASISCSISILLSLSNLKIKFQIKGYTMTYYVVAKESKEILAIVDTLKEAIEEKRYAWNKQGISAFIVDISKNNQIDFE